MKVIKEDGTPMTEDEMFDDLIRELKAYQATLKDEDYDINPPAYARLMLAIELMTQLIEPEEGDELLPVELKPTCGISGVAVKGSLFAVDGEKYPLFQQLVAISDAFDVDPTTDGNVIVTFTIRHVFDKKENLAKIRKRVEQLFASFSSNPDTPTLPEDGVEEDEGSE